MASTSDGRAWRMLPGGLLGVIAGLRVRASWQRSSGVLASSYPMFSGSGREAFDHLIRLRLVDSSGQMTGFWQTHHVLPVQRFVAEEAFKDVLRMEDRAILDRFLRFCLRNLNDHPWGRLGERSASPEPVSGPFTAIHLYYCGARMEDYEDGVCGPYTKVALVASAAVGPRVGTNR